MINQQSPVTTILGRSKYGKTVRKFFRSVFLMPQKKQTIKKRKLSRSEYHLSSKQVSILIETCDSLRNRVILKLLAYTGIRRAEVAGLKIEHILWDKKMITIFNGKGNKSRYVPLPEELKNDLKEYIFKRDCGHIVLNRYGKPISVRQLNRIVKHIGEKSGISNPNPNQRNLTCHLFRHTFARLWKDKGGDIETLSKLMGHASVKTTWDTYGTLSIEDVKENYSLIFKDMYKQSLTKGK